MTEILTESFCERCGTRYTFESAAPRRSRIGRVRTLGRGMRNFVLSDDASFSEAMAEARSEEEIAATAHQLDAFHQTFNFCLTCRQYTCGDCWNVPEGRCLTCAPLPDTVAPAQSLEAPVLEADARAGDGDGDGYATEAWPDTDLPAARLARALGLDDTEDEAIGGGESEARAGTEPVAAATAATVEEASVGPAAVGAQPVADEHVAAGIAGVAPGQSLEDAIAEYEARMAADDVSQDAALGGDGFSDGSAAADVEPEPVARDAQQIPAEAQPVEADAQPESPVVAEHDVPARPEPEPLVAAEPERLAAAELEPLAATELEAPAAAESEPLSGAPEPFVAAELDVPPPAEPDPVAATSELEPLGAAEAESLAAGAEPLAAAEAEPLAAEAEPLAAEAEPQGAPDAEPLAAAELEALAPPTEPEAPAAPESVAANAAPEAAGVDVVAQPVWRQPEPPAPPTAPVPPPPASPPEPSPWLTVAPEEADGQPQWPVAPAWPAPANRRDVPTTLAGRPLLPQGDASGLWAASAREVLTAAAQAPTPTATPLPTAQPCVNCGLSLSANARFCRRCGTRQG